jgi:hypothetical protein
MPPVTLPIYSPRPRPVTSRHSPLLPLLLLSSLSFPLSETTSSGRNRPPEAATTASVICRFRCGRALPRPLFDSPLSLSLLLAHPLMSSASSILQEIVADFFSRSARRQRPLQPPLPSSSRRKRAPWRHPWVRRSPLNNVRYSLTVANPQKLAVVHVQSQSSPPAPQTLASLVSPLSISP